MESSVASMGLRTLLALAGIARLRRWRATKVSMTPGFSLALTPEVLMYVSTDAVAPMSSATHTMASALPLLIEILPKFSNGSSGRALDLQDGEGAEYWRRGSERERIRREAGGHRDRG